MILNLLLGTSVLQKGFVAGSCKLTDGNYIDDSVPSLIVTLLKAGGDPNVDDDKLKVEFLKNDPII